MTGRWHSSCRITSYNVCYTKLLRVTEIVVRAIPLSLIALGIAVAFRSGILNIGAEGQMMIVITSYSIHYTKLYEPRTSRSA